MSARTYPRSPATDRIEIQLPWWSIALPAIAFAALLLLLLNPADAHATSSQPALTQFLDHLRSVLVRESA